MKGLKNILVIRFSALGDVAMTVPVIKRVLEQHPSLQITFVSAAFMEPLFSGIARCNFYPVNLKTVHKGFAGVFKIYKELNRLQKFDFVIDLHNVLRSNLLRFLFEFSGIKSTYIDKGRKEKKELTRKENKLLRPLKPTHQRYADVFNEAGLDVLFDKKSAVVVKGKFPSSLPSQIDFRKKIIGIAPFAKHAEKMYPLEKMKKVVYLLNQEENVQILFFGSKDESAILQEWQTSFPGSINISGKYSFKEELDIISNLHAMVSMDSANVHLASIYNVPVISIWGATHPFVGFTGWNQSFDNIVQIDLYCRPCSVFGDKPCYRGDHACMTGISEKMIFEKIKSKL